MASALARLSSDHATCSQDEVKAKQTVTNENYTKYFHRVVDAHSNLRQSAFVDIWFKKNYRRRVWVPVIASRVITIIWIVEQEGFELHIQPNRLLNINIYFSTMNKATC